MGLQWSAVTLAGHVTLCLAILLILWNALVVLPAARGPGSLLPIASPLFAFGAAFLVERAYYVVARLLVNSGINLWELHPAPDLLSGIVAAMGFWVAVAVRSTGRTDGISFRRAVTTQGLMLVVVYAALARGLW